MSFSSDNVSIGSRSLKGQDHRSASVIAQFNKRRLHGDYGLQPNAPSVGIRMDSDANTSALKATTSNLGPKLWRPSSSAHAQRASTLASSSSSSFIPEAHYVEDPVSSSLANKAATSAIQVSGEEYGAKYQPDAYKWGKTPSQWSHIGASRSAAAAKHNESRLTGIPSLQRSPPTQSIDISKVLGAAQANAQARLAAADNHLPANFGIQTEEEKALRRQQVLSLISIADQRVKARLEELNRDSQSSQNIFGSIEFQKIAMDVATRTHGPRLENHGKLDLGGGLYMTQDEVDDIARRNVQPVLDKVQLVADKKRIADREAAEREAAAKQTALEQKEAEKKRRAEEKQLAIDEKQRKRKNEQAAKQKRERAEARAKEQHPQGSHLWHWQQVEIIKEEVKEAKQEREDKSAELSRVQNSEKQAQEELAALVDRHHELKREYFSRGEAIETKQGEYDADAPETASLFELKQQRETLKVNTKNAKTKRTELEQAIEGYRNRITQLEDENEKAQQRHHDLKKKYFEARGEAEEAEKKWQIEEEARLKREAEERAKKEAEEAERKKQAAEAEAERKRNEAASAAQTPKSPKASKTKSKDTTSKGTPAAAAVATGSAAEESVSPDYKAPAKSKLLHLGDARTGPVLAGYKSQVASPTKLEKDSDQAKETSEGTVKEASKEEPTKKVEEKASQAEKDVSSTEAPESDVSKTEALSAPAASVSEAAKADTSKAEANETKAPTVDASKIETAEVVTPKVEDSKKDIPTVEIPEAETSKVGSSIADADTAATPAGVPSKLSTEDTSIKETPEKAVADSIKPTETEKVGGAVAGSVVPGSAKSKVGGDTSLEDKKDDFKGFESSNVKEKVVDDSPGVFKEDL